MFSQSLPIPALKDVFAPKSIFWIPAWLIVLMGLVSPLHSTISSTPEVVSPGAIPPNWSNLQLEIPAIPEEVDLFLAKQFLIAESGSESLFLIVPERRLLRIWDGADWLDWTQEPIGGNPNRYWRSWSELKAHTHPEKPLKGLHIALDPGHLGGVWAEMEFRYFHIPGALHSIREGDLNREVARRLTPKLEALGATVSQVIEEHHPLVPFNADDWRALAEAAAHSEVGVEQWNQWGSEKQEDWLASRMVRFWILQGDIRARADRVNKVIQPDLVLCIHFDAGPWPDGDNTRLRKGHHGHVLIHGACLPSELKRPDVRADLLRRLVTGALSEELKWGKAMARAMETVTSLPPFIYTGSNAIPIEGEPYLYARNLLANRLFLAPTLFLEPYVMNSETDHARLQLALSRSQASDPYLAEGASKDIFDEYVDFVIAGLLLRGTLQ